LDLKSKPIIETKWKEIQLKEITILITKGTTPTTIGMNFSQEGINFIKSESVTKQGTINSKKFAFIDESTHKTLRRSHILENDLLMSIAGMFLGKVAVVPSTFIPANTNQALAIIRLNNEVADCHFIGYFLRNPSFNTYMNNLVAQSAQPNLNLTQIGELPIQIPPLEKQKQMGKILSDLDTKIQNIQNQNHTLEQMAQAIFKSWFVDFDGVTEWEDSELGKIPKGWKVTTLKNHIDIKHGYAFKGEFFSDKPTKYVLLTPGNFKIGGGFKGDKIKYYDGQILEEYVLETNDLLVTMTDLSVMGDTLGFPMYVPKFDSTTFLHNQRLGKINIKNDSYLSTIFLYHLCCSLKYRIEILGSLTGTTVKHSSPERIMSFQFALPEENKIKKFDKIITSIKEKADRLQETIDSLTKTRDALLPKLMSGKIRV
jgi:type I restriction enzyme, S subunit